MNLKQGSLDEALLWQMKALTIHEQLAPGSMEVAITSMTIIEQLAPGSINLAETLNGIGSVHQSRGGNE